MSTMEYESQDGSEMRQLTLPRPLENEKLGLTVMEQGPCVVVTRILNGGVVDLHNSDQTAVGGHNKLLLGDMILEVNGVAVRSPEDLAALVTLSSKSLSLIIQRPHPSSSLKVYGIAAPPVSVSSKLEGKESGKMYVRALFDYDPNQDNLIPCADAGLRFLFGDVLAVLNCDDNNWWQAVLAEDEGVAPAKLIPSLELEERRKAFVAPEADYASRIGLCGALARGRKKVHQSFRAKSNGLYNRAELFLYEPVARMPPFQRRTMVLVGTSASGKRHMKRRLADAYPDIFEAVVPQTSRPKRPEEIDGMRYSFVDREQMEVWARNHELLEYGEFRGHLYGTRLESIREVIQRGKTCILDPSPQQSLKVLRASSEFMPFIVFLAAPGMDEMRGAYENANAGLTLSLMSNGKNRQGDTLNRTKRENNNALTTKSRRRKSLQESISSLYVEEDVVAQLEESARLQRAFGNYFDLVVVDENVEQTFRTIVNAWFQMANADQWVPAVWVHS